MGSRTSLLGAGESAGTGSEAACKGAAPRLLPVDLCWAFGCIERLWWLLGRSCSFSQAIRAKESLWHFEWWIFPANCQHGLLRC